MASIREDLEAHEARWLAPQAARAAHSRGRLRPEPEDPIRTAFHRDRDRIVHCKAFRRLKHKTQVFFSPATVGNDCGETVATETFFAKPRQMARHHAELFAVLHDYYRVDPREQYRRVKRASTLDRRSLAVLREITAWRELEAQRKDLPRRWVVGDESLVEIARRRPKTTAELASVRGVGDRLGGQRASGILSAVAAGLAVPDDDLPRMAKRQRTGADVGPIADLLSAVCRLRAREHGVAITLLATREDLERFASGEREGHPLAEGWRHTIVGADLEAVLDGRAVLRVLRGRVELSAPEPGTAASSDDDA